MKLRQRRPVRTVAVALVTVASAVGVTGCSVFSPPTVLKPYAPSDGTTADVGAVHVENALVVSAAQGQPGVVSVTLVNSGEEEAQVQVTAETTPAATSTFTVPAGGVLQVGGRSESEAASGTSVTEAPQTTGTQPAWFQLTAVPVSPGQTVPVTFAAAGQTASLRAPVVLPCFEYAGLQPTTAPTPVATAGDDTSGATEGTTGQTTTTEQDQRSAAAAPVTCDPATEGDVETGEQGEDSSEAA